MTETKEDSNSFPEFLPPIECPSEELAQEIARRWNTHADLLEALKCLSANVDAAIEGRPWNLCGPANKQAREAIAKATGQAD